MHWEGRIGERIEHTGLEAANNSIQTEVIWLRLNLKSVSNTLIIFSSWEMAPHLKT